MNDVINSEVLQMVIKEFRENVENTSATLELVGLEPKDFDYLDIITKYSLEEFEKTDFFIMVKGILTSCLNGNVPPEEMGKMVSGALYGYTIGLKSTWPEEKIES